MDAAIGGVELGVTTRVGHASRTEQTVALLAARLGGGHLARDYLESRAPADADPEDLAQDTALRAAVEKSKNAQKTAIAPPHGVRPVLGPVHTPADAARTA